MQIRISKNKKKNKNKWEPLKKENPQKLLEITLKNEISIINHKENAIRTPSLEEDNTVAWHYIFIRSKLFLKK